MTTKQIVRDWFEKWENGNFQELPLIKHFKHTSPYGTIKGKKEYLDLVQANQDKFLGHRFIIHDAIYENEKACIRYTAAQGDFNLEVSEWHFIEGNLIAEIIAYYNIEEERIKID